MATANQDIVRAALSIAEELEGIAVFMGMTIAQRQEINGKLQQRLTAFAEAILDQAKQDCDKI
jgi:hypothetical protein